MRAVLLAAALLAPLQAFAQDGQQGRKLAAGCAICHGTEGHAVRQGGLPSLAGLERGSIAENMRAFRDGRRPATVMHQIAKGYTDREIDTLAAWFSGQKR